MGLKSNQKAAILLGASVQKVFPQSQILETGATGQSFFCAFQDSDTFQESYLPLLERAMKEFAHVEIVRREMVPFNAIQFLDHHKIPFAKERLEGQKGVITLVQLGEYYDIINDQLEECFHFYLTDFRQDGDCIYVEGISFSSEQALKQFIKKFRGYGKKNHDYLAKELSLYEEDNWHPRGMVLRNTIETALRNKLKEGGFEEVKTDNSILYFEETGLEKFYVLKENEDQIYSFQVDHLISLLQLIESWVKIFDFDCQWILRESVHRKKNAFLGHSLQSIQVEFDKERSSEESAGIELRIADGLGRFWEGPKLEMIEKGIRFSLIGNLERFIALLLERVEGCLPFWIAPEQIRLISFQDVDTKPIEEILRWHQVRYKIEKSAVPLKEKIYQALRLKVPYVMVFGKQEERGEQIKVRAYGSSSDQMMEIQQLNQFLVERKIES